MRVMCIVPNPWIHLRDKSKPAEGPEYGDIDIVTNTYTDVGMEFYMLQRFGSKKGYSARNFIPLSDEEPEMEEKEEKKELLLTV